MPKIQKRINKYLNKHASEWTDVQDAWLGDSGGTVATGTPGLLFARLYNGKAVTVRNTANIPAIFDLHIRIGRSKNLPKIWQVIDVAEDYDNPATAGQIAYHHEQHMFGEGDELPVDRKQITALTVRVSDGENFIVQLYGDSAVTPGGLIEIASQEIDLSSYVVTAGAQFVNIETDDDGAITVNEGTVFGAPFLATIDDVPTPDPGKYLIAYILLYEGQVELLDEDIHVPMPLGMTAKSMGLQISEAAADTPADGDLFGFWDIVDLVLKKITWANIKATLKTYFDTLYAALSHTHDASEVTGQYRQFVYEVSGGDFTFVIDEDGNPVMSLEDLE